MVGGEVEVGKRSWSRFVRFANVHCHRHHLTAYPTIVSTTVESLRSRQSLSPAFLNSTLGLDSHQSCQTTFPFAMLKRQFE
jgi:hypothetical protein